VPAVSSDALFLHTPHAIPNHIATGPPTPSAPPAPPVGWGLPNGNPNIPAVLSAGNYIAPVPPPPPPSAPKIVHVSHMEPGALIHQVQPVYPAAAKITHTQGTVQLAAIIGRDGSIQDLRVVSGHPLLAQAAVDAVRQWRYRPYILNGQPVEVETQISVNFTLGAP
jgi:protein TonB